MSDLSIAASPETPARIEPLRVAAPAAPVASPADHPRLAPEPDRVELSDHALLLSRLKELPAVRADLIQRVRANIEAGVYDAPEVIDAVITRAVEDIDQLG